MKISRRVTAVLGAAAVLALPGLAGAQIQFNGTTKACLNSATIYAGCTQSEGTGAVTFFAGAFNNTTVNGVAGFNGLANNFGSLVTGFSNYGPIDQPFALQIDFVNPTIAGGQNQLFTANITGSINNVGNGGFVLHYDNPDLFFNYTEGSSSGVAHLKLSQDVGFDGANVGLLNGSITTTPEPSSMALLGTGLIGLVPMVRRKKKA